MSGNSPTYSSPAKPWSASSFDSHEQSRHGISCVARGAVAPMPSLMSHPPLLRVNTQSHLVHRVSFSVGRRPSPLPPSWPPSATSPPPERYAGHRLTAAPGCGSAASRPGCGSAPPRRSSGCPVGSPWRVSAISPRSAVRSETSRANALSSTLITGAAGFAGGHLLELLAPHDGRLIAWRRPLTDLGAEAQRAKVDHRSILRAPVGKPPEGCPP